MSSRFDEMRNDGVPEFVNLSRVDRVARKPYTLVCGCKVEPGQRYQQDTYLEDGAFKSIKGHARGDRCPFLESIMADAT